MKKHKRNKRKTNLIYNYIKQDIKEYFIITLIFIIGIVAGVIAINNSSDIQKEEINSCVNNYINTIKSPENTIDKGILLKETIKSNIFFGFILWFMGCTIIGVPIVYALIAYKGFSLSYTMSALISMLGSKGIGIVFSALFIHNVIFIPTILVLAVSGIKLYKSIMKDKRKENIKLEICRHSIISMLLGVALIIDSFIETYISTTILENYIKII